MNPSATAATATATAVELCFPNLLLRRCEGRGTATEFSNKILRKRSRKSLRSNQQVLSSTPSIALALTTTTSLDLSAPDAGRFLIAGQSNGAVALYDLSRWGGEESVANVDGRRESTWRHSPVAQALRAGPRSHPSSSSSSVVPQGHQGVVTSAKWYPADTGAFLTSSVDGHLLVWDTHEVVPVIHYSPFHRYASQRPSSARPGSRSGIVNTSEVLSVDSMDVSRLSCHSVAVASRRDAAVKLVDVRTGASSHSLMGHDDRGISCLRWSPASEFVLASAGITDRTVRMWDVRKSGPRACLTVLNQNGVPDATLSKAAMAHYGHLRRPKENVLSSRTQASSSDRSVLNLTFDPSGQFLVTHDGTLAVWDLRDGQGGFQLPRRFVTPKGSVQLVPNNGAAPPPPLCTTDDGGCGLDGFHVWTSIGSSLASFSVRGQSAPHQLLNGHIAHVQALASSAETMVSTGGDGLILTWGHNPLQDERQGRMGRGRGDEDRDNW